MTKKIVLTQGKYAIVDDEDYGLISKYKWYCDVYQGAEYAATNQFIDNRHGRVRMHQMVFGNVDRGEVIDHINGNGLDNRKCNLRAVSHANNIRHRIKANRNNTSGFRGVSWDQSRNKWVAYIKYNYKKIYLGRYDRPEIAGLAYDNKAKELFGEYAYANFPIVP